MTRLVRVVRRQVDCDAASRNEPPVPPSSVSLGYLGFTAAGQSDGAAPGSVLCNDRARALSLVRWLFEMYSAPDGRRARRSE